MDRFTKVVQELEFLHRQKSADYGTNEDEHANIRASEEFGIPSWLGAILRQNDKITRVKSFIRNGRLENESLRDSLLDNAVYAIIALAEFDRALEEEQNEELARAILEGDNSGHSLARQEA